jgi:hypothetical protein
MSKPDPLIHDWQALVELTGGAPLIVERVRIAEKGIAVEGAFQAPQLARLTAEDQVFVAAFVKSHGSIKEMERVFGVSYPTIKARLNRIAAALEFIDIDARPPAAEPSSRQAVLDRLERGEIDADEAVRLLEGQP